MIDRGSYSTSNAVMPGNVICLNDQREVDEALGQQDCASSAVALTSLAWSLAHEMGHIALRHLVRGRLGVGSARTRCEPGIG